MHKAFHELVTANTPKATPEIMNGLAMVYVPRALEYIDNVFKSASKSFPQGLEYIGYKRCTPVEEFNEITRSKNNKRTFDLATSDLYLVKFFFRFNGEDLDPRFIYLPFVRDGGIFRLGGSLFHISPVLTDKVISPASNSIFVRLLRDKVNFERLYHSFKANNNVEMVHVVWSSIYRKNRENNKVPVTTKAKTCNVHYLLAKHGLTEMFQLYAGFTPVVGEENITPDLYPKDQWVICESTEIKPKTNLDGFYEATRIKMAIPIEHWNSFTKSLVAGCYYAFDHFPSRMRAAWVDRKNVWMILLGHIIFSGVYGEGKLYDGIQEHFNSLDEYVDSIIIAKLSEIGFNVNNFYELLALIVRHADDWIVNSAESNNSMFSKSLEVLYYVLFDITAAIFRTNFKLNKAASKKQLTKKEIVETMNKHLKMGEIFKLTRGNIAVSSVSYSGDLKYPKITSVIAQQQSTSGATRGRKTRVVVDASKRIHPSMVEAGSLLFLSKSNPSPTVRANMYMNIDLATGNIVPKPKFEKLRARVNALLKGFTEQVNPE
jgi:hypothetical protein